jgi:TolB-like protein/tetratricopeptide (TPR) repeat protein
MSFVAELKRRSVIRVGAAYLALGWVVAQVGEFAFDTFGAPDWALKSLVIALLLGLPVVLFGAWAFELTPDGIRKDAGGRSTAAGKGRKLDRAIIVMLVIAVGWFAWDKFAVDEEAAELAGAQPATTVAASDKSVAVLPFVAMSNGPDDEFFADGLTEEILNSLAQLPELLVTARTSAFSFKGRNVPIPEIAATLGVAHVVEGSVRRQGDRLRVTAQLVRADNGFHLWSETYDRPTDDLFDVQADVATSIAGALEVVMDDAKRERMLATGTRNVAAFEAFIRGRGLYSQAHGRGAQQATLEEANEHFERALELDPGFVLAALMHADRFAHQWLFRGEDVVGSTDGLDAESTLEYLRRDLARAMENAHDEPTRIVVEINREFFAPNWNRMPGLLERLREPIRAGAPMPDQANILWLNEVMLIFREYDMLEALLDRNLRTDPLNSTAREKRVHLAMHRNDFAGAARLLDEARRTLGDEVWMYRSRVMLGFLRGDPQEIIDAVSTIEDLRDRFPGSEPLRLVLEGDADGARQRLEELDTSDLPVDSRIELTHAYTLLDQTDRAYEIVRETDASPGGPAALAVILAGTGRFMAPREASPNLVGRLREAGIDPTVFPVVAWDSVD